MTNFRVVCNDCEVECEYIDGKYMYVCPKCKEEWWVDG